MVTANKQLMPPVSPEFLQLIDAVNSKYGAGTLQLLSQMQARRRISTGIDHLDCILGGGLPAGGILEVVGINQSGKTTMALSIAGQAESVLYIDGERKLDFNYAQLFGVCPSYTIAQPYCLEEALELARIFLQAGVKLIVVDSLPSLPPRKEAEGKDFDKVEGMAMTAGILARKLPVLNNLCYKMDANILIVNQYRDNINRPTPWSPPYHTFGGWALRHYALIELVVARTKWEKDEKLGTWSHRLGYFVNKSWGAPPQRGGDIQLVFGRGWVPHEDVPAVKKSMRKALKEKIVDADPLGVEDRVSDEEIASVMADEDETDGDD